MTPAWRAWGIAFALAGTVAVAFRPVFIKLAYAATAPGALSPTTLVFLRMMITFPVFAAMAWWPRKAAPIAARDWWGIVGLGIIGYYAAAILRDAWKTYGRAGIDIRDNVPVLVTLYNLGDVQERADAIRGSGRQPQENYMGLFVRWNSAVIESIRLFPDECATQ